MSENTEYQICKPEPRIKGKFAGEITGRLTMLSVAGNDVGGDLSLAIEADDGTAVAMYMMCGEDNDRIDLTITRNNEVIYQLDGKDGDKQSTPAMYYDKGELSVSETGFTFWDWSKEDAEGNHPEYYLSVEFDFKAGTATFKLEAED